MLDHPQSSAMLTRMKAKNLGALALTVSLCSITANQLSAGAQWPQFRGPNCQGIAETDRPPVEFGPATNLLWKTPLPAGVSSPCVWSDRVFLTAINDGRLETLALNRGDGKLLWRQPAPADKLEAVHKTSSPASSTPATDGERACFLQIPQHHIP